MSNNLFNIRAIIISLYIVHASREEWVEVPQIGENKNYKVGGSFGALSHSGVLSGDHLKPLGSTAVTKPNQAWLDYQMERFGLNVNSPSQSTVVNNVNRLTVTDRMDFSNKSLPATVQFHVPLNVYSSAHPPQNHDRYDTVIEIHSKPKPATKATAILHHHNKIDITAIQPDDDQEEEYEDEISGDPKTTERSALSSSEVSESDKLTAFQKFLRYMKSIQKDFILKASMNINEKISYLNQFKDVILLEIEDRIKSLWPADEAVNAQESRGRVKRGIWAEDTHMAFPSNETTLMTINFLTFAVFLIKLVLKVINTIKSKHYTYNGLNVNTMEALKIGKSRKIRSNPYLDKEPDLNTDFTTAKIHDLLHNFENKFKLS